MLLPVFNAHYLSNWSFGSGFNSILPTYNVRSSGTVLTFCGWYAFVETFVRFVIIFGRQQSHNTYLRRLNIHAIF